VLREDGGEWDEAALTGGPETVSRLQKLREERLGVLLHNYSELSLTAQKMNPEPFHPSSLKSKLYKFQVTCVGAEQN
jgi:hypothetical protein